MPNYKAPPLSRKDIRNIANKVRRRLQMESNPVFPILALLETLTYRGIIRLEILPKEIMGTKLGETFPSEKLIRLREDVYNDAADGKGYARATAAHELFHFITHKENSLSLCRTIKEQKSRAKCEDPDWQADCFAGELLVSKELVVGMSPEQIVAYCKVSPAMARCQYDKYIKEDNE